MSSASSQGSGKRYLKYNLYKRKTKEKYACNEWPRPGNRASTQSQNCRTETRALLYKVIYFKKLKKNKQTFHESENLTSTHECSGLVKNIFFRFN